MFGLSSFQKNLLPRVTALALCLSILAPMVPAAVTTASAEGDVPYYQAPMEKLTSWDVLSGYPDGELHPERPVTRAEFVAMVNRAYGYDDPGPTPFTDVPESAWYADDIGIAYNTGYFSGTTPTTASPDAELTREQAMVLLAHNMRLEAEPGEVTQFTDGRDFSSYSKGYVKAAVKRGLISGFPDGSFQPRSLITRGQMATILSNALGSLVTGGGTQALGSVYGNLTINEAGTTLQDTTITGDLYISGGLDLGAVTLENVRVLGNIIVSGGGEVESGQDSVILRNVEADNLLVDSLGGQYLSLRAEGDTLIDKTSVRTGAFLQDRTPSGLGLLNISLEGRDGLPANFSLSGNLETVVNRTPGSDLIVSRGTVKSLTMDEKALGSALTVDVNTTVKTLNLDTAVPVQGVGDVETLNVSTPGSTTTMFPDKIVVRPGVNVMVSGTNMDSVLAEEATQAPRLLAGYPSAKNIAPTSADAWFSTNKAGTVYWAVSAISDGSVGESELLSPSSYGSPALKSGNLNAAAANSEINAAVTGLTKGGTYYLSAMLVDTRGAHSPVKTISFETPDDSVPNFASGSPAMSKLSNTYAQATATTTKNCDLHWALYAQGSTAPTADDFKSGALDGSLDSGIVSGVVKNYPEFIDVGHRDLTTDTGTLEELASYDLYMWLNDADNSKSSAVRKLTFTTVDKTPPRFISDPKASSTQAASVGVLGALNETGTVYWVAVAHDADYPKPPAGSAVRPDLDSDQAKFQVEHGLYGLKSGKVSAREGQEFTFNITGLEGESAYDVYYVAQDAAGNYSEAVEMLTVYTLDNAAPSVTQAFSKFSGEDAAAPYAYTNVDIIFSEDVQWAETMGGSLLDLYKAVEAASEGDKPQAKDRLAEALRGMITLYDVTESNNPPPVHDKAFVEEGDPWVIDYREATVKMDGEGHLVVTFPNGSGIQLKSGSTYYFRVQEAADFSGNELNEFDLPRFTTISAQVGLNNLNLYGQEIQVLGDDGTVRPITAHGGLSLDPISTETVADGRGWDMLIWTTGYLKLELYKTEHTRDEAGVESPAAADRVWELVDTVEFKQQPGEDGYRGRSLTKHFNYTGDGNFQDMNALKEMTSQGEERFYDFAFRVTELNDNTEDKSWSETVYFEFDIVSGGYEYLAEMGIYADRETYTRLVDTEKTLSDDTLPKDFNLRAPFIDSEAPYFTDGNPTFLPGDSYVTISHLTSRPCTVYYYITPIDSTSPLIPNSLIPTTQTSGDNVWNDGLRGDEEEDEDGSVENGVQITKDNYRDGALAETLEQNYTAGANLPTEGLSPAEVRDTTTYPDHISCPLTSPTAGQIKTASTSNPNVKRGQFSSGRTPDDFRIDGLTKLTDYLCYFVLEGTGSISRPQVFYFRTADTQRPAITLTWNSPTQATINTTDLTNGAPVESTISYALILDSGLPAWINAASSADKSKTILELLTTPTSKKVGGTDIPQGSEFDEKGTEGVTGEKKQVQDYLDNAKGSASGTITLSEHNIVLNGTGGAGVGELRLNFEELGVLTGNGNYTLLVTASDSQGSGSSYAARQGFYRNTSTKPLVSSPPQANIDFNQSTDDGICGSISITLNGPLHNYNQSRNPAVAPDIYQAVDGGPVTLPSGSGTREDTTLSLGSLSKSGSDYMWPKLEGTYQQPIDTLTIRFGYNKTENRVLLGEGSYQMTLSPYRVFSTTTDYDAYFTNRAKSTETNGQLTVSLTVRRVGIEGTDGTITYNWVAEASVNEPWRGY